jgi:sugar phosphate isomerase/epimerase
MIDSAPSVQLYTVRDDLETDLAATLERLAAIGFRQVEPYRLSEYASRLGGALRASGLVAPTSHATFLGTSSGRLFDEAAALGIEILVDPYVEPERWQTADDIQRTADQLNAASELAARSGVCVGYHNHAHELESKIDGRTALEHFADLLEPEVALEVDTYWAAVGGVDPAALLMSLGDRVAAIHVKDGPATPVKTDQVPLGSGSLDLPAILSAAPGALRVVELDGTTGDIWAAVEAGFGYLTAVAA